MSLFREPGEASLQKAKLTVERNYQVVGITERMQDYFSLLEFRIPSFFSGASEIYKG